jgi:hypothetical protein
MTRHGELLTAALALTLAATAAQAAAPETAAKAAAPDRQHQNCFPAGTAWQNWSAAPGGDVLYLRVYINDIYRVDLTPGSHVYKSPGYFLVNEVRGSGWLCSAIDLDLTLASDYGFRKPLIATSMRKLTPAEVAAIPKKDLP